jgi:acetoin utilization deacetylase AcuC-like enzyme
LSPPVLDALATWYAAWHDMSYTLILFDPDAAKHDPGPEHPESPWRWRSVGGALLDLPPGAELRTPTRLVKAEDLFMVHSWGYVARVLELRGKSGALDHETMLSPGSVDAALGAVGACIEAVDEVLSGNARNAFVLVRPPGHHAARDRSGGYCVFNNAAIACAFVLARGMRRVLVVDIDAHRGDGTQEIFATRNDVLVASIHQTGLFPAEPDPADVSEHINFALPPGSDDRAFIEALDEALRRADGFEPEFIVVSAGFDGHEDDPMSDLAITTNGYAQAVARIREFAEEHCHGRLVLILEGGYDGAALAACVAASISVLAAETANDDLQPPEGER